GFRLDAFLAYLDHCKRDPNATLVLELGNVRRYDLNGADADPSTSTDTAALTGTQEDKITAIALAQPEWPGGATSCRAITTAATVTSASSCAKRGAPATARAASASGR